MTLSQSPPWPRLVARLRHLLVNEGYGYSSGRFPGNTPVAARSRTVRHVAASGPDAPERVVRDWPDVASLPIWNDLRPALAGDAATERPDGPAAPAFDEPLIDPRGPSPRDATAQLLRRLVYLHADEFDGLPVGLVTLSRAWTELRRVEGYPPFLVEAYQDSYGDAERRVIRFCLRDLGLTPDEEFGADAELFLAISAADRNPLTLQGISPERIERLRRAGALSSSFDRSATVSGAETVHGGGPAGRSGAHDTVVDGRFVIERRFPGSEWHSLHLGVDREGGVPVLVTTLFVVESEPLPDARELAFRHDGVAPLLHLGRERLSDGLANVMVEALPRGWRNDAGPLPVHAALQRAVKVLATLRSIHASGRAAFGLRPELTFLDGGGGVTIAPRGPLFRRLCWPEGPTLEFELPPFLSTYTAPETLSGSPPVLQSDVFSFCATIVCWITGRHPFARDSVIAQLLAMQQGAPDCRGIPDPLAGTLARGLSPSPAARPSLDELGRAIFSHLSGTTGDAR